MDTPILDRLWAEVAEKVLGGAKLSEDQRGVIKDTFIAGIAITMFELADLEKMDPDDAVQFLEQLGREAQGYFDLTPKHYGV